jgi:hypothetical protein
MRVLVKDNRIPVRVMHEVIVLSTDRYKWIETLKDSVGPEDINLSEYEIRRICVDLDLVTIYVLPKEQTNGQNRHNPDPT